MPHADAVLLKIKIRIVLDGLRGEESIAGLCRREGIVESLYCSWSKEFLEAGKKRLTGNTSRAATTDEVKDLRREARDLKVIGWGWMYLSTILDDDSRYIIVWKLCTLMKAEDVSETLELALKASGCDQARARHKPRL